MSKETRVKIAKEIIKAYESADFTNLYPLFSDDILWCSQWVIPDRKGKEEVVNYYDEKAKQIKASDSEIKGLVIETVEPKPIKPNPLAKRPSVVLVKPAGEICVIIGQRLNGFENHMVIEFKLNDKDKITELSIADPSFYTFKIYDENN